MVLARTWVDTAYDSEQRAVFATAGMALPDRHYPEELARQKTARRVPRPIPLSLANPFWLVGYPLSVGIMRSTTGSVLVAAAKRA